MENFFTYIKPIVFFLLLECVVLNLLPEGGFRKLFKLCMGIILILLILSPVCQWTGGEIKIEEILNDMSRRSELRQYEDILMEKDEYLMAKYFEEYERVVRESIGEIAGMQGMHVYQCDLALDREGEGMALKSIYVLVGYQEDYQKEIEEIESIHILVETEDTQESGEKNGTIDSPVILKIKNDIIDIYHIAPENLTVEEVRHGSEENF